MSATIYGELRALIDEETRRTEIECRGYLKHARSMLIDQTSHDFIHETSEYRGHSGNSDYVIVCRVREGGGTEAVRAYIWEVKAPQCYLFEFDTMNRVCPTHDLVSAENQLLHYYEEAKGSEQFREEFGIVHSDNVRLGGIIIGSQRTRVNGSRYDAPTLDALYARALNTRMKHLYTAAGIKLLIWDRIAAYLQTYTPPAQTTAVLDTPIVIAAGAAVLESGNVMVETTETNKPSV